MTNDADMLEALVNTGILLSSEHSIDVLLEQTLKTARSLFGAEGASLYLADSGMLHFRIFSNPVLEDKLGPEGVRKAYKARPVKIGPGSISGYTAYAGESTIVTDAYNIPGDAPYSFNTSFDKSSGYKTVNLATVPMKTRKGKVVGVLQLVNLQGLDSFSDTAMRAMEAFGAQVAVAVENATLTEELKKAQYETITRLAAAAELKDPDTGDHLRRMSEYSRDIADACGLDEHTVELIYYASPLHDVGKIAIPDDILLKPGPLDDDEWEVMRTHTVIGADILRNPHSELAAYARDIALCHHERIDGKGYPSEIKGDDIPFAARVVSVADVFDALTSRRPYKEPFPAAKAIEIINEGAAKGQFDPEIVKAFLGIAGS
ncbi:MAG: HD domain-containing protein [Planctomycetes bacterium]|nr:HD domain-containing protein [Planctomycetota bacterium]